LCIDEVTGALPNVGGGAAGAVATAVNTGSHHAVLSSILLQQQRCAQSVSLLHMHVDNQFQAMKTFLQRQNTTLNGNIRRFGGTIQGGFARQDPLQASNRRTAAAQLQATPQHQPEDGTTELCPIVGIWWSFGMNGNLVSAVASLLSSSHSRSMVGLGTTARSSDATGGSRSGSYSKS